MCFYSNDYLYLFRAEAAHTRDGLDTTRNNKRVLEIVLSTMLDRQSFGDAALQRAKLFVYRLDKKAVLDPKGVVDVGPIRVPQYVPSSMGSSTGGVTNPFSISKRFSSRVPRSETGVGGRTQANVTSVAKERTTTPDDNGDGDGSGGSRDSDDSADGSADERICRLERKVASLTFELNQLVQKLEALYA